MVVPVAIFYSLLMIYMLTIVLLMQFAKVVSHIILMLSYGVFGRSIFRDVILNYLKWFWVYPTIRDIYQSMIEL